MSSILIGLIIAIFAGLFIYQFLWPRWQALRTKARLICTCGYLPDPPSDSDGRILRLIARFAVWLQIGEVKVSGLDNLACETPKLIVPTHGHYLDPFVFAGLVPEPARAMAARGLLRFGGGLGALLFSRWGAFCTDLRPGKGTPALRTAVRVLASGQTLLMFPEGWANMDGAVRPFKPGVARIAHMAASRAKKPVAIVPVYLEYGRYPGKRVTALPTAVQCLIMMVGFVFFRRGVHVVCGQPLLTSDLPGNSRLATEQIRNAVLELKPTA